jgi:predicted permease
MEEEIATELAFHIESYAGDLMRGGMAREEALRRARIELGGIAVQHERWRVSIGLRLWDDLCSDLRYALRQFRRAPAFKITVLSVLALGIGANAAMFSVIDATLLRWLPYHRPGQLVSLGATDAGGKPSWLFLADIEEWQRQTRTSAGIAYYADASAFVETPGGGRTLPTLQISPNLFAVLGVQPAMGRGFSSDEQTPGQGRVAVLSDSAWRSLFAADSAVLGKHFKLNDQTCTVVGVMPRHFLFPANENEAQIWVPAEISADSRKRSFSAGDFSVLARLRDGAALPAAIAEISGIQKQLVPLYDKKEMPFVPSRVQGVPYRETLVQNVSPALKALSLAVGIIWLIACANVASLMLARGMSRQREIAVRGALGASRGRIVRQLFTESLLLSLAGATMGLSLSQVALRYFSRTLSARLNLPGPLVPNTAVLAALLGLSVLSAVLFGFFPAWLAARMPLEHSLRQGSAQAGQSRQRHRLQQAMVIAEIGLSLVLLVSCGLMLRTVFALRRVPLGFRTDHVLLLEPKLPSSRYPSVDVARAVYRPLLERVQQIPGVQAASLTTVVPLRKSFASSITFHVLRSYTNGSQKVTEPVVIDAKLMASGPELQDVLGFRMYQGRYFNQQDTPDSPPVAVVNRAFANLYLPDGNIIDHFSVGLAKDRRAKIVGVMDDFHQASIDKPSAPEIDLCAAQLRAGDGLYQPTMLAHIELAIRTAREPASIIPDLRRVMTEVSPDLESSVIDTMDQVVEDSMGSQLLAANLLKLLAGSALVVALAGLYGLMMYLVTQRTQELGVRIALGAQRGNIIQMLLGQAGRLMLAGAGIGLVLAYFSTRMLASFLYGVSPHDARTMISVTALLILSGLLAAYIPARKASRLDPIQSLRGE